MGSLGFAFNASRLKSIVIVWVGSEPFFNIPAPAAAGGAGLPKAIVLMPAAGWIEIKSPAELKTKRAP